MLCRNPVISSSPNYPFLLDTIVPNFCRYSWKPLTGVPNDPSLVREAAGGELMEYYFRALGLGDYVVIFMAELTFFKDFCQEHFLQCAKNAWAAVRYDIPLVAAQTVYDEENRTRIVYKPARSADDAEAWASRTVRLVRGFDNIEQFRHSISSKAIRDANCDQTFLYVLPHERLAGRSSACSMLVHTSHITFDGKGVQIMFTAFMKKLAAAISVYPSAPYQQLEWGSEGENVLPPPYEIFEEAEVCEGPEYRATLESVMNDVMNSNQHGHGLNIQPSSNNAHETKRAEFTFAARESRRFFKRVKRFGFTVNHVCHGALVLACAEHNPVPAEKLETAVFTCLLARDGRPRLRTPFSNRDGYPGYCLGGSQIQIPASALNNLKLSLKHDVSRLFYTSRLVKKEYARQKAYPSLLAIAPEQAEMMMHPYGDNQDPPLPSTAPWYTGDGRGELYLDPVYFDDNGKAISEIRSFVTTVNKFDPAPYFRVWSWRDCLTLSVDYNPCAVPENMVQGLLDRWKQLVAHLMIPRRAFPMTDRSSPRLNSAL